MQALYKLSINVCVNNFANVRIIIIYLVFYYSGGISVHKFYCFHFKAISSDSDSETESDFGFSDGGCTDEEDSEAWHEDVDGLLKDVASDEPLPEPIRPQSSIRALSTLLQWFVNFLLFWQATCKISDNGLEWLLRFMFQFLHLMGITCNSDYICQMAFMLPTSLFPASKVCEFKS